MIDYIWIMWGNVNRCYPLESIFQIFGVVSINIGSADEIFALLTGALVIDSKAAFTVRIDDMVIPRLGYSGPGFTAPNLQPEAFSTTGGIVRGQAGNGDSRIVLLPGV